MRRVVVLVLLALSWTAFASPRSSAPEVGAAPRALTGMFTYMADAAIIALCGESERLPVTMEADYKALEAAYLKERPQLGQAILVSVEDASSLVPPRRRASHRARASSWNASSASGLARRAATRGWTARCATPTGRWCA